jgi:hypothetical protein
MASSGLVPHRRAVVTPATRRRTANRTAAGGDARPQSLQACVRAIGRDASVARGR